MRHGAEPLRLIRDAIARIIRFPSINLHKGNIMRKLYIGGEDENDTGNGNPPPNRQRAPIPVEKDPVDFPAKPADEK